MVKKKEIETDADAVNARKRKRLIPTRAAGTPANPAFGNPADELFAKAFAHRTEEKPPKENSAVHIIEELPSTKTESSRPQLEEPPSTEKNVDVSPSTSQDLPSTKTVEKPVVDVSPSVEKKPAVHTEKTLPSTKQPQSDRHGKHLARYDNRINPKIKQRIDMFCAEHNFTQREIAEQSAVHFMDVWTAKFSKNVDGKTAHDDGLKMIMWKTAPAVINLYRAYNFENKWKFADDDAGQKYNSVDLRLIELGIIETQFNSNFKKINSFSYYKNQIDVFIDQKLGEEMLGFLLKHYREKWQKATGREVDLKFLENKKG